MRVMVPALLLLTWASCPPNPPTPPTPPPPSPVCQEGQYTSCWHRPPEAPGWLYRCAAPWLPDGYVDVTDPATCPVPPPTPPPPTPPPPVTCDWQPKIITTAGFVQAFDLDPQMVAKVGAAEAVLRQECSGMFRPDGKLADQSGPGADKFNWGVAAILARDGIIAGQSWEGRYEDKLYVRRPDGLWEAFHTVSYSDWSILAPAAAQIKGGFWSGEPPPPPAACPAPRWESYEDPTDAQSCSFIWGLKVGHKWIDATLNVRRCCGFCRAIGMGEIGGQMRCQCPLRNEDNLPERFACEAEVGAVWKAKGGALVTNPDNIAEANCEGAGCQVQVCTKSGVCSGWAP